MHKPLLFQPFTTAISGITLPNAFTFPFYYEPHELSLLAAQKLQDYLVHQTDFEHNFGLKENQKGLVIGKMFGVLVCQNKEGEIGYLWAFSGKLAASNHLPHFVPPVFDLLETDGFFKKEEEVLNALNREIERFENDTIYLAYKQKQTDLQTQASLEIEAHKSAIKNNKQQRELKRAAIANASIESKEALLTALSQESKDESILLKKMTKYFKLALAANETALQEFETKITLLKEQRKLKSSALQQKIFTKYTFLNALKETKSIGEIFDNNPPAGAGECAAPKLLHYAFLHDLKPIAMAEFWWGQSPKSEIRKHQQFYPSCKSKCEPILMGHMLKGLVLEANPFMENPAAGKQIEIVYEDEVLLVVNKPAEFLAVPGKNITDSVYQRIRESYPEATGPLVVHRLDMSTSGIMLVAKNEETYVKLQRQFSKRTLKKRYVAVLDGIVKQPKGTIDLPLRVDLDDRPRQLVCYEHGKSAQTHFEVLSVKNKQTRIHFYPITGRTHQLRVHASHALGLNIPIVGDDLYGTKANRLHLHAEWIQFEHPVTGKQMEINVEAPF